MSAIRADAARDAAGPMFPSAKAAARRISRLWLSRASMRSGTTGSPISVSERTIQWEASIASRSSR